LDRQLSGDRAGLANTQGVRAGSGNIGELEDAGVVHRHIADHGVIDSARVRGGDDQVDIGSVDETPDNHTLDGGWLSTEEHVDGFSLLAVGQADIRGVLERGHITEPATVVPGRDCPQPERARSEVVDDEGPVFGGGNRSNGSIGDRTEVDLDRRPGDAGFGGSCHDGADDGCWGEPGVRVGGAECLFENFVIGGGGIDDVLQISGEDDAEDGRGNEETDEGEHQPRHARRLNERDELLATRHAAVDSDGQTANHRRSGNRPLARDAKRRAPLFARRDIDLGAVEDAANQGFGVGHGESGRRLGVPEVLDGDRELALVAAHHLDGVNLDVEARPRVDIESQREQCRVLGFEFATNLDGEDSHAGREIVGQVDLEFERPRRLGEQLQSFRCAANPVAVDTEDADVESVDESGRVRHVHSGLHRNPGVGGRACGFDARAQAHQDGTLIVTVPRSWSVVVTWTSTTLSA